MTWRGHPWAFLGIVVHSIAMMAGIGLVALGVVLLVSRCESQHRPPPSWHGINPDVSTCQPDVHRWPGIARTTCISGGTFYTCLLNSQDWVYECAPGIAPMEKP